jgi:large subunit ribosomal protein L37Ae
MSSKKKIGSAGRFGSRYGKKVRQLVSDIERTQKQRHICPKCDMPYVDREVAGIWKCRKCGTKFAGGAWTTVTRGL